MNNHRIDIAAIRKEQIVEAAVAVIAEQGLHNLSLSEIETRAGMKRGQLTYYFKHKEDILLAVFDRVLQLMYQRLGRPPGLDEQDIPKSGWELTKYLLEALVTKPPVSPEFHCLQYTFLSQIGYREDFRERLAKLYEEWRGNMAKGLAADLGHKNGHGKVPPRALATLIQALLHGLTLQAAADPEAFDGQEMMNLCVDVLGSYLGMKQQQTSPRKAAKTKPATHGRGKAINGAHTSLPRPLGQRAGVRGKR
jgi:AcrR family transcriptional regulator